MARWFLLSLVFWSVPAFAQSEDAEANRSFDAIMQSNQVRLNRSPRPLSSSVSGQSTTAVPLEQYEALREQLREAQEAQDSYTDSPVVLGASRYNGSVVNGVLQLRLEMHVTLGNPNAWKAVPLVGETVVVVSATQKGRALPLIRENGYHVWLTRESGEVDIQVDLRVPARGPDGSIEYAFRSARTPVTQIQVEFPVPDLQPRITSAVSSRVSSTETRSTLNAALRPTARIELVGYRRLEQSSDREAKVYVENLTLASLDDSSIELFTVLRYKILYAGTKNFEIEIPAGYAILSAEGEGAFRYDTTDDGKRLRGETAFPIRDNYEISLRLKREVDRDEDEFILRWPHALGTERQQGWLALEVPGKRQLEVKSVSGAQPVDVRQLPSSVINSAVSPVLGAFRFIGNEPSITTRAARLPEQEPAGASIDQLNAWTVMSEQGPTMTEIKLTLRNRLRHRLRVLLPDNAEVRSVLLDGEPVKPSRDDDGALVLPLKRSSGGNRLTAFTLQLVYAETNAGFGILGKRQLALPGLELPIASVNWSVHLPERNRYSELSGEVEQQGLFGYARWHAQPVPRSQALPLSSTQDRSSVAGAAPIRIQIPKSGRLMNYRRYWLDANRGVDISFWYTRRWLRGPVLLLLWTLVALAVFRTFDALIPGSVTRKPSLGLSASVALFGTLVYDWLGDIAYLVLIVPLLCLVFAITRFNAVSQWLQGLPARWRERTQRDEPDEAKPWWKRTLGWTWTLALGGIIVVLGFTLAGMFAELLWIFSRPWSL